MAPLRMKVIGGLRQLRQTKVGQLRQKARKRVAGFVAVFARGQQDVARLDVAMQHAPVVRVLHRGRHLSHEPGSLGRGAGSGRPLSHSASVWLA